MFKSKKSKHLKDESEMTKEEKIVLNAKTAMKVRFDVYKGHYYDCTQVDDVMDALLALIDMQDDKIRFYEKRIVDEAINKVEPEKKTASISNCGNMDSFKSVDDILIEVSEFKRKGETNE